MNYLPIQAQSVLYSRISLPIGENLNYIAHLHLAQHTQTDLLGNFMGDFVKGNQWQFLPESKQVAIKLHRWVDGYTDRHSIVRELFGVFPKHLRRYAGMALDIYFDHILLTQWHHFDSVHWSQLFDNFYAQLQDDHQDNWPVKQHYHKVRQRLLEHRWLHSYKDEITCLHALRALEQRARFKLHFAQDSFAVLTQYKQHINEQFTLFYPDLLAQSLIASTQIQDNSNG